jgi:hypothetical protein
MAEKILTPEEKKYLGKVSRYLSSLGMKYGEINFEMDTDDEEISYNPNDFPTHFDNNYTAEIPDGLVPILKKIIDYFDDADLYSNLPDGSDIDYQRFEITIDGVKKEISLTHIYSYFSEGDSTGIEYDDMIEEWEEKGVFDDVSIPEDGYLILKYNGGGDSGYIESDFENGEPSPGAVEEWCYQQLKKTSEVGKLMKDLKENSSLILMKKQLYYNTHTIPCWMNPIQYGKKNFKVIN